MWGTSALLARHLGRLPSKLLVSLGIFFSRAHTCERLTHSYVFDENLHYLTSGTAHWLPLLQGSTGESQMLLIFLGSESIHCHFRQFMSLLFIFKIFEIRSYYIAALINIELRDLSASASAMLKLKMYIYHHYQLLFLTKEFTIKPRLTLKFKISCSLTPSTWLLFHFPPRMGRS